MELPQYFPVADKLRPELERLNFEPLEYSDLQDVEDDILKTAKAFLDQLLSDEYQDENLEDAEHLSTLVEAYTTLKKSQKGAVDFRKHFSVVKADQKAKAREEEELSIRNIDSYKSIEPTEELSYKTRNEQDHSSDVWEFETRPNYLYLKNAAFVLKNPLDPLPLVKDRNQREEDDDDLQVEGGKIDLKCPVTLKLFEDPYTSKKCGHTFNLEGIKDVWKTPNHLSRCPILGCSQQLTKTDFVKDNLMLLRVKSYQISEKREKGDVNYEKL